MKTSFAGMTGLQRHIWRPEISWSSSCTFVSFVLKKAGPKGFTTKDTKDHEGL